MGKGLKQFDSASKRQAPGPSQADRASALWLALRGAGHGGNVERFDVVVEERLCPEKVKCWEIMVHGY